MADFPENEIKVLDDDAYVSDAFITALQVAFSKGFDAQTDSLENVGPRNKREHLQRIANARKTLSRFLHLPEGTDRLGRLRAIMGDMANGNFPEAQQQLTDLVNLPPVTFTFDFGNAFNNVAVDFFVIELLDNPMPGKPPIRQEVPATLPRYAGPRPSDAPGQRVVAWSNFLAKGPEHTFRTDLLQAEIDVGLRKFGDAIDVYERLLTAIPSDSPRHKFVALRAALAHLGLGDQLFRKQRILSDQDRQTITDRYDQAVRLLDENGVSPDNPLRQQIEAQVARQRSRLANGLNYLGLWDAFVPNQRFTTLQQITLTQIGAAKASTAAFQEFLRQADDEKEKQLDVQLQTAEEARNLSIVEQKQAIATLSIDKIDEQLRAIDDQQEFLAVETVVGHFRAIVDGAVKGGELGLAASVVGLAGNIVNFLDQNEQLDHQRRTAEIERQIAQHQAAIAAIERRISELRIAAFQDKLARLQGKRLNADVLYELAALNEQRAVRQLETAIFLAYLFERALAFNLGKVDVRHIQFDYLDRPPGIFDAASALEEDFNLVGNELAGIDQEKLDFFEETISLRESYPIQFSRFLQTGEMDFVYSLYQLSKSRPDTHQCRLREVGVEVRGLLPPTGFSGTLTHDGRFLVRDKQSTLLDPNATRLVPTDEQLAQALEDQRRQGLAAAAVGGVLFYTLDPESKQLSQKTQFVSTPPPSQVTLDLLEGIGPTGLWHLEIREHGRLSISDILLHFAIVSHESDPFSLEPKVEALIRSFEAELSQGDSLDQITAFSLRQTFADAFFALETGQASFTLVPENFPAGLTNLQHKLVIAQAVDAAEKGVLGVALELSRPDRGLTQARVTGADGFSEDLDAPPQTLPRDQRFPVVGQWQVRLPNPAQFAQLGDLRLFFMYAFEEL